MLEKNDEIYFITEVFNLDFSTFKSKFLKTNKYFGSFIYFYLLLNSRPF